jgi:hypothetical protein
MYDDKRKFMMSQKGSLFPTLFQCHDDAMFLERHFSLSTECAREHKPVFSAV